MPWISGNLTPNALAQVGRIPYGYSNTAFPGPPAFLVVTLDEHNLAQPIRVVITRGTEAELQGGGAVPITVDMELLAIIASSSAPTADETLNAALLTAALAGQAPSATSALTLALQSAAAAGQAPTLTDVVAFALQVAASATQPPGAAVGLGVALLGAGAAPQAPGAATEAAMPLLAGGPGTQPPTPGAAADVPLAALALQLFDPDIQIPLIVDVPLLEALVFGVPMFPDLEVPPPLTRGYATGRTEPKPVPIVARMEILEIRTTLHPPELGIWTVRLAAQLEARLEALDPDITTTWPADTLRRMADDLLLDEEDPVGLGV